MAAWACLFGLGLGSAPAAENEIYEQLVEKGLPIDAALIKLPVPSMADGLDAAGQLKAMQGIANANTTVERLLERGVNAPFRTKFRDSKVSATSNAIIRGVDVWFVVYSDLDTLANQGFLRQLGNANNSSAGNKAHQLTADELQSRKIVPYNNPAATERYVFGETNFFDRVRATGTSRTLETRTPTSMIAAGILDGRFVNDKEFPNRWFSLKRDEAGKVVEGPAQEYTGGGSYVKATKLHEPAGAVFIEYHVVYHEPYGWFEGGNLIASKLPPVLQDNIRKLRRQAADAKKPGASSPAPNQGAASGPLSRRYMKQNWLFMLSSCVLEAPSPASPTTALITADH